MVRNTDTKPSLDALDWPRVVALALVTLQHTFTLTGRAGLAEIGGVWIGQAGVAIFLAISGYCAALSHKRPRQWLMHRLIRLYPAYWLAMLLAFALTAMSGHKSFTLGQFAAQMLGIGAFTHPHNLVNQSMWFITILLVAYVGWFLLRVVRMPLAGCAIVVAGMGLWCATQTDNWICQRLLPFYTAALIAQIHSSRRSAAVYGFAGVLLVVTGRWEPAFSCTGLAMLVLAAALARPTRSAVLRLLTLYSYEYFLLHGIFLAGVVQLLPAWPMAAIAAGLLLTAVASVLLHHFVQLLVRRKARHPAADHCVVNLPCKREPSIR